MIVVCAILLSLLCVSLLKAMIVRYILYVICLMEDSRIDSAYFHDGSTSWEKDLTKRISVWVIFTLLLCIGKVLLIGCLLRTLFERTSVCSIHSRSNYLLIRFSLFHLAPVPPRDVLYAVDFAGLVKI